MAFERVNGVFVLVREVPSIGGLTGDRIVLEEDGEWPVGLARELTMEDARWAFERGYARLESTSLDFPEALARRILLERWQRHFSRPAKRLKLLP